ncbi:MAG: RNA methyltransferase [Rhodobacterales bacterium]|nr:MAG: RNA methyltransferase [Rhodobacterales bacterium]
MSVDPAFILVRPQMGENIGAAARAMWNFGLDRMRVVAARDGWPNERAVALASGAGRVLDGAVHYGDLAEAVADCAHVYATTARPRELTMPVMTPAEAMADAQARIARGERVAVMFGAERTGLENSELALANTVVSVPVNPAFPSLNLAQCVLLTAYEWRQVAGDGVQTAVTGESETASQAEVEALARHYEERMDAAGFFFPETKAEGMRINLRNLWSRMPLTRADVQMLHGVLRQMVRWKERG